MSSVKSSAPFFHLYIISGDHFWFIYTRKYSTTHEFPNSWWVTEYCIHNREIITMNIQDRFDSVLHALWEIIHGYIQYIQLAWSLLPLPPGGGTISCTSHWLLIDSRYKNLQNIYQLYWIKPPLLAVPFPYSHRIIQIVNSFIIIDTRNADKGLYYTKMLEWVGERNAPNLTLKCGTYSSQVININLLC